MDKFDIIESQLGVQIQLNFVSEIIYHIHT